MQYFSQDSLWLPPDSLIFSSESMPMSNYSNIDLTRIPTWRFTTRRRHTSHGASEYYSDIEVEQTIHMDEQNNSTKKSLFRRRPTNIL